MTAMIFLKLVRLVPHSQTLGEVDFPLWALQGEVKWLLEGFLSNYVQMGVTPLLLDQFRWNFELWTFWTHTFDLFDEISANYHTSGCLEGLKMTLLIQTSGSNQIQDFGIHVACQTFDREQILDTSHYNSLKLRKDIVYGHQSSKFHRKWSRNNGVTPI